jgi:glucose-1-phosphate thymidylyltransferase
MKALILSAGYGTRLYPLSENKAKALLPIGGKAMVEHIIEKVEDIPEIDEICMVVNRKFYQDFRIWLDGFRARKRIRLFNDGSTDDSNKLGAIGDIRFAIERGELSEDLLVVAGDNLFDFDMSPFVKFSGEKGTAVGLYRVQPMELARRYSVVDINEKQRLLSFKEKPEYPRTNLIAICLYLFPKEKLELVSEYLEGGNNPDAPGYYIKWLVENEAVYGFPFSGRWFDIGDLKSYEEAEKSYQQSPFRTKN